MTPTVVHNVNFHGLGEPPRLLDEGEAMVWLSIESFVSTLDKLRTRSDVRLSFDDSNRSDVDLALPRLLERGMTATFFVLAGRLDDPYHLGASDLVALKAAGMVIGSHGMDHVDWRRCSDCDLQRELTASRRVLEDVLGVAVTRVAVPFGSYDRRVLDRVRRDGGYQRVFTSDGGPGRGSAWLQPRTTVPNNVLAASDLAASAGTWKTAERAAKRLVKRWR